MRVKLGLREHVPRAAWGGGPAVSLSPQTVSTAALLQVCARGVLGRLLSAHWGHLRVPGRLLSTQALTQQEPWTGVTGAVVPQGLHAWGPSELRAVATLQVTKPLGLPAARSSPVSPSSSCSTSRSSCLPAHHGGHSRLELVTQQGGVCIVTWRFLGIVSSCGWALRPHTHIVLSPALALPDLPLPGVRPGAGEPPSSSRSWVTVGRRAHSSRQGLCWPLWVSVNLLHPKPDFLQAR